MPRLRQDQVLESVKNGHVKGRFISPKIRFFRDDYHSPEVEVTDAVWRLEQKGLISIMRNFSKGTATVTPKQEK